MVRFYKSNTEDSRIPRAGDVLADADTATIHCGEGGVLNQSVLLIDSTLSHHKPQDHQPLLKAVIASQGGVLGGQQRHPLDAQDPPLPPCCAPGPRAEKLSLLSGPGKWG